MSSDNEYVTLLQYAIHLHIDLTTFPTLWAVLSILLNTQDGKCEYVKCLQEEYNNYYEDKSTRYMLKLERQSAELQNHTYDSVTHNFDSFRSTWQWHDSLADAEWRPDSGNHCSREYH